jgi:hypothetical protein
MASDHLSAEELNAYRGHVLAPVELLRISDHLAECSECRERVARKESDSVAQTDLSYEELIEYLDENIDPLRRRELSEKLRRSPSSRVELKDLARFRDEMNALAPNEFGAASSADQRILIFPSVVARWALPLAAAIALTTAGIWWSIDKSRRAVVNLRDGNRDISVGSNGQVKGLPGVPDDLLHSVGTAIRKGKIEIPPVIDSLASDRGALAGVPNESSGFELLAPVTTRVRETTPIFRWKAQKGATNYRVHVADSRSGEVVITGEADGAKTEWTPAEPLAAGKIYQWQVEALRDDEVIARSPKPPEPEARFQILPAQLQQQLAQTETQVSGSHLVTAVADAKAGLLDDAVRELQMFAKENPGSKIPAELIAQIEIVRRAKDSRYSPIATKGAQ